VRLLARRPAPLVSLPSTMGVACAPKPRPPTPIPRCSSIGPESHTDERRDKSPVGAFARLEISAHPRLLLPGSALPVANGSRRARTNPGSKAETYLVQRLQKPKIPAATGDGQRPGRTPPASGQLPSGLLLRARSLPSTPRILGVTNRSRRPRNHHLAVPPAPADLMHRAPAAHVHRQGPGCLFSVRVVGPNLRSTAQETPRQARGRLRCFARSLPCATLPRPCLATCPHRRPGAPGAPCAATPRRRNGLAARALDGQLPGVSFLLAPPVPDRPGRLRSRQVCGTPVHAAGGPYLRPALAL